MNKFFLTALFVLWVGGSSHAQDRQTLLPADQEIPLKYGADRLGKRSDAAMQKFRDNRLGAFIHWGLYAIPGGEWNGKVYNGAAEWLKSWAKAVPLMSRLRASARAMFFMMKSPWGGVRVGVTCRVAHYL